MQKHRFNPLPNIYTGYLYSQYKILNGLTSILGVSIDIYNDAIIQKNQLNPKIGLIWSPINNLTIRGATYSTLKKPLVASQTIEPTQIAGFNQFLDDLNGTTSWNYGVGIDFQPYENLYIGGEVIWRAIKQPIISDHTVKTQDRNDSTHLAYIYWSPLSWATFSSEYQFSKFKRDYTLNNIDFTYPRSISTHIVPLSINLYHSSGLFSKFSGTFIDQNIEFVNDQNSLDKDSDNFWTFDTAIGFRLPNKFGSLSLEVRNLFDKNHKYHSTFDASGSHLTDFVPEREFFFKLNIAY